MQQKQYLKFLKTAKKAAKEAGKHAQKVQTTTEILSKDAESLGSAALTQADRECEKIIRKIILQAHPEHGFVGEEFGEYQSGDYTWYVDPIDGTANYARQSPLYGVIIGLEHENEAIVGVIYFPELDVMLHASKDGGAWRDDKQLRVSKRKMEQSIYLSVGLTKGKLRFNQDLLPAVGDVRIIGSGSVEYGEIAQGRAEIRIGGDNLHDDLAGVVLIREAGGKVTNLKGEEWKTNHQNLLATNKVIHQEVLNILNK